MEQTITLTLQAIARMSTRSTSYNVKDIERALRSAGLDPVRDGVFFTATQDYHSTTEALVARKNIEKALKRVHRNAIYSFKFLGG